MKSIKKLSVLFLIGIMVISFAGCAKEEAKTEEAQEEVTEEQAATEEETASDLGGQVTISGSTSVEKIAVAAADEFMANNPDVEVTYEGLGSSVGIKNAKDEVTMLGTASRDLKEEEKGWGLTETVIAYDGVAVITHPSNPIKDISMEQIMKIYTGEITNWKDVGGNDSEIVVVSRESGSGTRGAFEELVGFEDNLTDKAMEVEKNGGVQTTVAGNENAIGYVSFTYINETVKALTVNGVEPTSDNVLSKTYAISRPFLVVYKEDKLDDASKAYIDFVLSEAGQAIVEEEGGIPLAK